MSEKEKIIDIEKVIGQKNPKLLRFLPGFVLRYIKRILHEDEINHALHKMKNLSGIDFAEETLHIIGSKISWEGLENIPSEGGCIIASNHPLGGLDGVALIKAVHQKRPDIKFLVNDVLMHLEGLRTFWVPVNKHGANGRSAKEEMEKTFSSECITLIFPAGLVSRKQEGKIKDLTWKKATVSNAIKFKRDIIPTYIEGKNSAWFYNLAWIRKKLGIKANLEMFYLVDELFKQKGKKIHIKFGKPISYKVFEDHSNHHYWSQKLKDHVYKLGEQNNEGLLPTKDL